MDIEKGDSTMCIVSLLYLFTYDCKRSKIIQRSSE